MRLIYTGEWCGNVVFNHIPFREWLLSLSALLPLGMLRLMGIFFAGFPKIAVSPIIVRLNTTQN